MFWFHPKSVPGSVVREALTGDIIPVINNQIVAEYDAVKIGTIKRIETC